MSTVKSALPQNSPDIDTLLREVLARFPALVLALVFGSVAQGRQRADSDLDIAVAANRALTATEKMDIIAALAEQTGRPVDLIDLTVATEPLLGQILRHGRHGSGSSRAKIGVTSSLFAAH